MIRLVAVFTLIFSSSVHAFQCAEGDPIALDALIAAEKELETAQSSFAKIKAYKEMLRTRDRDFLTEVIALGLENSDRGVKAAALRCKVLISRQFTIKTLPFEEAKKMNDNLQGQALELVSDGGVWALSGVKGDPEASCVSLRNADQCDPVFAVIVSGEAITLRSDYQVGRFELDSDQRLVGEFTPSTWHKVPYMPVELFLE